MYNKKDKSFSSSFLAVIFFLFAFTWKISEFTAKINIEEGLKRTKEKKFSLNEIKLVNKFSSMKSVVLV
jgi:hypothetical protein